MANDPIKKKKESLRKSISTLETKRTVLKEEGASPQSLQCIDKLIERFESDLKKLKAS